MKINVIDTDSIECNPEPIQTYVLWTLEADLLQERVRSHVEGAQFQLRPEALDVKMEDEDLFTFGHATQLHRQLDARRGEGKGQVRNTGDHHNVPLLHCHERTLIVLRGYLSTSYSSLQPTSILQSTDNEIRLNPTTTKKRCEPSRQDLRILSV